MHTSSLTPQIFEDSKSKTLKTIQHYEVGSFLLTHLISNDDEEAKATMLMAARKRKIVKILKREVKEVIMEKILKSKRSFP